MNISHQNIDEINASIQVEIAPEDYNPQVDKAIKDQAKQAKLPGFRPGMVPTGHIKRMYGKAILFDEINKIINDKIAEYISEQQLEVLGQPLPKEEDKDGQYNWDFKDTFNFDYELGIAPKVDIPLSIETEFTEYDIKADETTPTDRIKNVRPSYGKMTNAEGSQEGHVIHAALQRDKEHGIQTTTSLRTDNVEDA